MTIERLEREKDDAENELEALRQKDRDCLEACRAAFETLQDHCNRGALSYVGRVDMMDATDKIVEAIADFTSMFRAEVESRLDKARGDLENAEALSLQKSAVR